MVDQMCPIRYGSEVLGDEIKLTRKGHIMFRVSQNCANPVYGDAFELTSDVVQQDRNRDIKIPDSEMWNRG